MAKYMDVSNWLRGKIMDGTFAMNKKIPSENKLAAKFGYSRQTVRQAIGILEAEGILVRAQGSGTFVSGHPARLRGHATMRIGVVITYPDDYIFPGIIHGIEDVLSKHHYTMVLGITHNRHTDEENALRQMMSNGVDGLIVEGTKSALPNTNGLLYREILDRGIPVVFLNGYYRGLEESYVTMDDVEAGKLAAKALVGRGHKSIGGIFKSDDIQGLKRYEGVQGFMRDNRLSLVENSVFWYTTEDIPYLFNGDLDAVFLSRFSGITGLICYNDQIAAALVKLFARHAVLVPEDISVVSFDDSSLAETVSCGLTSVIYPSADAGCFAAELILKKLSDPACRDCIILTPKLNTRGSVRDLADTGPDTDTGIL